MLNASEGKIIKTVQASNFIKTSVNVESGLSEPVLVKITKIPRTPNAIDA